MGNKRLILIGTIIVVLFFIGLVISCKERNFTNTKQSDLLRINSKSYVKTKIIDKKFNDTAFKNVEFKGAIKYNMSLDSLKRTDLLYRHVIFYASTEENSLTFEQIEKTAIDADVLNSDSIIVSGVHIFNFKGMFKKLGNDTLRLAIEDVIVTKGDTTKETLKTYKNYTILPLPVIVLDSSSIVGYKGDTIYFVGERMVKVKRKDSLRMVQENQRKIDSMKRVLNNQ